MYLRPPPCSSTACLAHSILRQRERCDQPQRDKVRWRASGRGEVGLGGVRWGLAGRV